MTTCFRKPPITTYRTPAARHGPKIASLNAASLSPFFFSTTSDFTPAALANSNPFASGLLEITRRISTGKEPLRIRSIKLRSVVPPPEIRTAIVSGAGILLPLDIQRHLRITNFDFDRLG